MAPLIKFLKATGIGGREVARERVLVCYPYTPANRSDVLALARTHFMYLASADSLHPSSINHTDAHTSSERVEVGTEK